MKKLVSILLCITILISNNNIAMADSVKIENEAEYYSVNVEYTDALGEIEQLSVMIQNNNVYVNIRDLAMGLGYGFGYNDEYCTIENRNNDSLPYTIATFYFDSTQVVYQLGTSICTNYEAPFISIKDEDTIWIPFEYSIYLLKSSMLIVDDCIVITMPEKTIIDYIYEIQKNTHLYYGFTYEDDFGYTDTDVAILSGSNHVVNVFNGLLDFDGESWGQLFDSISIDSASFDSKYGQEFTTLFCTQSDKELTATIDKVEKFQDLFLEEGKLYSFLELYSDGLTDSLMSGVGDLTSNLDSVNPSTARTSEIFMKLSNTLDEKELFSETGGMVMDIQAGLSESLSVVDKLLQVAEVVEYANEFSSRDTYAVSTLDYCIKNSNITYNVSDAMMDSIEENIELLESSLVEYTATNFIKDNLDEWIKDAIPMKEVLGTSAAMTLIAWDLASTFIPFVSEGLSSADQFELSLYALVMQENAYCDKVCANSEVFYSDMVMTENLYEATLYNYMYLKCCLITREAALATLVSKRESVLEEIQPLIDEQNTINEEIAVILVELKEANETNEGMVYGFLLEDNAEYLENYDDTLLTEFCIGEVETESDQSLYIQNKDIEEILLTGGVYFTEGEGFLCDINQDGVDELILLWNIMVEEDGNQWPCYVTSVYTVSNNQVVNLLDREPLVADVGGPSGRVAVVKKDGNQYFTICWETGETSGIDGIEGMERYGEWTRYSMSDVNVLVEDFCEYDVVYHQDETKEGTAIINNDAISYEKYATYTESYEIVKFCDMYTSGEGEWMDIDDGMLFSDLYKQLEGSYVQEQTEYETNIWKEFLESESYRNYDNEYEERYTYTHYALIDIDQNGVDELLVQFNTDDVMEEYQSKVFSYDTKSEDIIYSGMISHTSGIQYSENKQEICSCGALLGASVFEYQFSVLQDNIITYQYILNTLHDYETWETIYTKTFYGEYEASELSSQEFDACFEGYIDIEWKEL